MLNINPKQHCSASPSTSNSYVSYISEIHGSSHEQDTGNRVHEYISLYVWLSEKFGVNTNDRRDFKHLFNKN
jgi:hypothetical protein